MSHPTAPTPTSTTEPYTFQRPSTMATRAAISNPAEAAPPPTPSSPASSNPATKVPPPTLQRRTTNHYEEAVAAAAGQAQQQKKATATAEEGSRPDVDRRQSWTMNDVKRERHEQLLAGAQGRAQGYTSTTSQ